MKGNVLTGLKFTLGIQEDWDSYDEVEVEFQRIAALAGITHHVFSQTDKEYWLSPRYVGQQIEALATLPEIMVNVSVLGGPTDGPGSARLVPLGTGILRLRDT